MYIYAGSESESIIGNNDDNQLIGDNDDDDIYGRGGNDTIEGGLGDDELFGGSGDDVYVYRLGDGNDRIFNFDDQAPGEKNADILKFEGIAVADIDPTRMEDDLLITIRDTGDVITVVDHFKRSESGEYLSEISALHFDDGFIFKESMIRTMLLNGGAGDGIIFGYFRSDIIEGREGADVIHGHAGGDFLFGQEGRDFLDGGSGNDRLVGGKDDDLLFGASGDDTYVYGLGDGNDHILNGGTKSSFESKDRIFFETGISPEDVRSFRDGDHLMIEIIPTGNRIRIFDHFVEKDGVLFDALHFLQFESDGSEVDLLR